MALGEEVGDAYISVHADTKPFRREIARLRKQFGKEIKVMSKDVNDLDKEMDELEKPSKGKTRAMQMKDQMHDLDVEGKKVARNSKKWISPELAKSIDHVNDQTKTLQRTFRDTFNGKGIDSDAAVKEMDNFQVAIDKNAAEMESLRKEADKVSITMEKNYNKNMKEAGVRTLDTRNKTADLRTEFTKLGREANRIGDQDGADRINRRLTKLNETTRDYEKSLVGVSKGSDEWIQKNKDLNKQLNGLTVTLGHDKKAINERVRAWNDMAEVQTEAIAVNKEYDRSMLKMTKTQKTLHKTTVDVDRGFARFSRTLNKMNNPITKVTRGLLGMFKNMRGVTKPIVILIAAAGNLTAALGSGLVGALLALVGAAGAAVAALAPLAALLGPLVYGFTLLKKSFTDDFGNFTLDKVAKMAPEAARELENLGKVIKDIDAGAMFREWNDSLAEFAKTLANSLEFDDLASSIGKSMSAITDSLTAVINSDIWQPFIDSLEGPVADAMTTFAKALEPLIHTLLTFLTAVAPMAKVLADMFLVWATNMDAAFSSTKGQSDFLAFMDNALRAFKSLSGLIGSLKDALGNVFAAGIDSGIRLIDLLTEQIDKFNEWSETLDGDKALTQWFADAETIMMAVGRLVGDLGSALGDLVTPDVILDLVEFLDAVGAILPIVGDLLSILGQAHILTLFAEAVEAIGLVLEPLVEPMTNFFKAFSAEASELIDSMGPGLTIMGEAFGEIFDALAPLMPILQNLVTNVFAVLAPLVSTVATVFANLLTAITPVLDALTKNEDLVGGLTLGFIGLVTAMKVANKVHGAYGRVMGVLEGKTRKFQDAEKKKNLDLDVEEGIVKKSTGTHQSFIGKLAGLATQAVKTGVSMVQSAAKSAAGWATSFGKMTVGWAKTAGAAAISGAKMAASAAGSAAKAAASWLASMASTALSGTVNAAKWVGSQAAMATGAVVNAAKSSAAWVASAAKTSAAAVATAAKWVGQQVVMGASSVAQAAKSSAAWVASTAKTAAAGAVTATKWVANMARMGAAAVLNALKSSAAWVASNAKTVVSIGLATAAMVAQKVAVVAGTVATGAATAAQWLFNAAMMANPITLIIIGITALIAALVAFFTQTEIGIAIWNGLVDAFTTGWEWIKNAFNVAIDFIIGLVQAFWDFIKLVFSWTPLGIIITNWDAITAFFSSFWETVKGFFQSLWDFIVMVFNKLNPLPTIKRVWGAIIDWFSSFVETVKGFFTDIKDSIMDAFKSAFNFVSKAWNNTIGKLSWTLPSWVPGIGGKTLKAPTLPMFAGGTIADKPTVGVFGEAGAEALVPLNRPLNQVDPSVRALSAFAQGLGGAGTQIAEGAIVINTPATNGRVIAESVLDRIVAFSR